MKLPFQCKHPLQYAMFGISLACVHIYILYHVTGSMVYGIKLSSHIYSFFLVIWLFSDQAKTYYNRIQNKVIGRMGVYVGRVSFFMYLTHCLILFSFSYLHLPNIWYLRWLLCIILSTFMVYVCDRMCPVNLKKYVGFLTKKQYFHNQ